MRQEIPSEVICVLEDYFQEYLDITRYKYYQVEEPKNIRHQLTFYVKDQLYFDYLFQSTKENPEQDFACYLKQELERTQLEKRILVTIEDQERIDLANNS